jgi:DNA-directed RNA polymerase specialized sigma24 family protein
MSREQKRKQNRKFGIRKKKRHRRFWRRITTQKYDKILEIARRFTKDLSDAYDLAQSVVLRLLKYCPKPVAITNFDGYIYATTKNAWVDTQRSQKEINLSDLDKTEWPQLAVLDPRLTRILASSDTRSLISREETNDPKLLQTIILKGAGWTLPKIAVALNEPVRRTRYRWYRYRDAQKQALRSAIKKNSSSRSQQR